MVSVVDAVEEVVKSDTRIHDAVRMGIANNRRLAQHIQADVGRITCNKPAVGTIAVTLQRLGSRIKAGDTKYSDIFGRSQLQLRDDISILYMKGSPDITEPGKDEDCFYVKIQGIGTTTALTDDRGLGKIEYKSGDMLKKISGLSAIIITSPDEIVDTPGVVAHLMMALGGRGINVVEVTSSYDKTFLIVDKKDSLNAVGIVRSLINRSRK